MGVIRSGAMKIGGKKCRIKVFGYEKDGNFVECDTYISQTDLTNIGVLDHE